MGKVVIKGTDKFNTNLSLFRKLFMWRIYLWQSHSMIVLYYINVTLCFIVTHLLTYSINAEYVYHTKKNTAHIPKTDMDGCK